VLCLYPGRTRIWSAYASRYPALQHRISPISRGSPVPPASAALKALVGQYQPLHGRPPAPVTGQASLARVCVPWDSSPPAPAAMGHDQGWAHSTSVLIPQPSLSAPAVGSPCAGRPRRRPHCCADVHSLRAGTGLRVRLQLTRGLPFYLWQKQRPRIGLLHLAQSNSHDPVWCGPAACVVRALGDRLGWPGRMFPEFTSTPDFCGELCYRSLSPVHTCVMH
jgi:hypothetical protein